MAYIGVLPIIYAKTCIYNSRKNLQRYYGIGDGMLNYGLNQCKNVQLICSRKGNMFQFNIMLM
jgi:hypothetical protein